MCYSAMVEQDAQSLARKFDAQVDYKKYADLFKRRLEGEKLYLNKALELQFLNNPKVMEEKAIGKTIREWQEKEFARLKAEIEKQKIRLAKAGESLKLKETKKALEDQRIATNKISKCEYDLKKLNAASLESDADQRIYPLHYVSVLCLNEKGEKSIQPMRYLMRPHGESEDFDRTHNGCYNARFDNLTKVAFWRDSLEKGRHGILVVRKFFENVPTENYLKNKKLPQAQTEMKNIVVAFEPRGFSEMYIPVLWDHWQKKGQPELLSAALITDDPPAEVSAAGHDRCPLFLSEAAIEPWLLSTGEGKDIKELFLSSREKPYYDHQVLGVA